MRDVLRESIWLLREKPLGFAGGLLLVLMIVVAAIGPMAIGTDPYLTDLNQKLLSPSAKHLLGTDELGRDLLARLVYGARLSMLVGIAATLGGTGLGALIGLISGYAGGRFDQIMQRVMDVVLAVPTLILAMAIMVGLGTTSTNVILAIGIPFVPRSNRVVRAAALSVKHLPYIESAQALGLSPLRILSHHLFPNCLPSYIVIGTALLGTAVTVEASLSFLGLGIPPPNPSWGRSLSESMLYFQKAPWLAIFPGLAISLAVFGANLLGDALRDIWDPRLKRL